MKASILGRATILIAQLVAAAAYAQVPVIPGASGYGIYTPAGRGGRVILVTSLAFDGPGTLKACVDESGPRVCVFEVSGTIMLDERIVIRNPNITIAGQTAPAPGVVLAGNEFHVQASDVLVQHIRIRSGDNSTITKTDQSSAANIGIADGVIENIIFDHVSVSWGIDEAFGISNGWRNITIRNSIISEGLHDSLHSKGAHSKGVLIDDEKSSIAMIGNLLAHNHERNPLVRSSEFVFANNVVYNFVTSGTDMAVPKDGSQIRHSVVGNVYIKGPDSGDTLPLNIRTFADAGAPQDSKIYLSGNRLAGVEVSSQWDLVKNRLPYSPRTSSAPAWPRGLDEVSALQEDVLGRTLENVGARPVDRDDIDKRIVNDVLNRTGRVINCVADDGSSRCSRNAGGWPKLAENRHRLEIPSDINGDADGDGYTNLEEWLHEMARKVEGAMPVRKPNPPELFSATTSD